jgi:hypothetical protein
MRVEIAIDDCEFLPPFKHGGDRKDRQRKAPIAEPGGFRIVKDDHKLRVVPG